MVRLLMNIVTSYTVSVFKIQPRTVKETRKYLGIHRLPPNHSGLEKEAWQLANDKRKSSIFEALP